MPKDIPKDKLWKHGKIGKFRAKILKETNKKIVLEISEMIEIKGGKLTQAKEGDIVEFLKKQK